MSTLTYLEQFFDNYEDLPPVVRRGLSQIRELDIQAEELSKYTDKLSEDFLKRVNTMSQEERETAHDEIQNLFDKVKALADEKVQLADETHELVHVYLRHLDLDLARFASELKLDQPQSGPMAVKPKTEIVQKRNRSVNVADKKKWNVAILTDDDSDDDNFRNKKPRCEPQPEKAFPVSSEMVKQAEPTYCFCKKKSSGAMICCNNPNCAIGWFHFTCVGLAKPPGGKWICPYCSTGLKKKEK